MAGSSQTRLWEVPKMCTELPPFAAAESLRPAPGAGAVPLASASRQAFLPKIFQLPQCGGIGADHAVPAILVEHERLAAANGPGANPGTHNAACSFLKHDLQGYSICTGFS